ncbi:MAG: TonB-dependent receptor [Rubrivivax sp.]
MPVRFKRAAVAAAVASALLGLSQAAQAADAADAADAAGADGKDRIAVDRVVVTAQKRKQVASSTPLALSVIGGDDLKDAGAVRIDALSELMPNVEIAEGDSAHGMTVRIRGVSSSDFTDSGDPSAAFNLDGIYIARPQAQGLSFYDLERIEVLRGPQGTLYGRNATAGAINVITHKPVFRREAALGATLGNLSALRLDGMVNQPLGEALALRVAFARNRRDGTLENTAGGERSNDIHDDAARAHLLARLGKASTLLFTLDTARIGGVGPGLVPLERWNVGQKRVFDPVVKTRIDDENSGAALEFKHDFGGVELSWLSGSRDLKRNEDTAHGELPFPLVLHSRSKQISHELRVANSGSGALQWVAGAYAFRENSVTDYVIGDLLAPGVGLHWIVDPTTAWTKALFGQGTYAVQPELRLTAGLRYSRDKKHQVGTMYVGDMPIPYGADASYSKASWRLGVDYDASKTLMLYASLATGYKAGGFNQGSDDPSRPNYNPHLVYQPENLLAAEIGAKGRLLEGRLSFNLALFDYDYRDLQLSAGQPPNSSSGAFATLNAAKASVRGIELDGRLLVGDDDMLTYSLGLMRSKYKGYLAGPVGAQQDWSGRPLDNSPETNVALGWQHTWSLQAGGSLTARVNGRYSSSYVVSDYNAPRQFTQDGFTKLDLSLGWESASGAYAAQLFVKNATDKTVIRAYSGLGASGGLIVGDPRLFGLRLSAKF